MSNATDSVNITILDKEYRIVCPPEEREILYRTAQYLDERMREIHQARKAIGTDRIAVLAALNITHDLLELRENQRQLDTNVTERLEMLAEEIDRVIEDCKNLKK